MILIFTLQKYLLWGWGGYYWLPNAFGRGWLAKRTWLRVIGQTHLAGGDWPNAFGWGWLAKRIWPGVIGFLETPSLSAKRIWPITFCFKFRGPEFDWVSRNPVTFFNCRLYRNQTKIWKNGIWVWFSACYTKDLWLGFWKPRRFWKHQNTTSKVIDFLKIFEKQIGGGVLWIFEIFGFGFYLVGRSRSSTFILPLVI